MDPGEKEKFYEQEKTHHGSSIGVFRGHAASDFKPSSLVPNQLRNHSGDCV